MGINCREGMMQCDNKQPAACSNAKFNRSGTKVAAYHGSHPVSSSDMRTPPPATHQLLDCGGRG